MELRLNANISREEYLQAKKRVDQLHSLKVLRTNPHFQKLIEEGYLKEYPLTLSKELSLTVFGSDAENKLISSIKATALFEQYLKNLEDTIHNDEAVIEFYESNE